MKTYTYNYTELNEALIQVKERLMAIGELKTSYVAVLSAITSKVHSLSKAEQK